MVDCTGCDEAKVPDSPPNRALLEATRAYSWALVVEVIGANAFAIE
jgi:hypothetical protein